jgi:hypothetical protein
VKRLTKETSRTVRVRILFLVGMRKRVKVTA